MRHEATKPGTQAQAEQHMRHVNIQFCNEIFIIIRQLRQLMNTHHNQRYGKRVGSLGWGALRPATPHAKVFMTAPQQSHVTCPSVRARVSESAEFKWNAVAPVARFLPAQHDLHFGRAVAKQPLPSCNLAPPTTTTGKK